MPANDALCVLVVDDDPIFRSLVEARLLRLDCRVIEAADGGEAWTRLRTNWLDLAIIDFEMPGLDGIGLVQCLRSHPQTAHIPVVMCTSRSDSAAMRDALDAGVSSFLTKPVNWSMFERHIRHLLQLCGGARAIHTLEQAAAAQSSKDALVSQFSGEIDVALRSLEAHASPSAGQISLLRQAVAAFSAAYTSAGAQVPATAAQSSALKRSA